MNRTLTLLLFLAIGFSAVAQTPTVVEKPASKTTAAKPAAQNSSSTAKPSPSVKTGTTQRGVPTTKPAVVTVQPVTAKPVIVPATKAPVGSISAKSAAVALSTTSNKPVAVPVTKPTSNTKPVAVAVTKSASTTATKPAVVGKPIVGPMPNAPHVAVGGSAVHASVQGKAVAVKAGQAPAVAKTKDPFNKAKPQASAGKPAAMTVAVKDSKPAEVKTTEPKKISAAGRRDPFISPVVNLGAVGSGCSSGKRCLAIDSIALKGVVRSDNGMIAVVVNAMDKAYFLRENDPVFNGYVVKITADSIVFKETFHDKLGKPLTRDVTKSISRPVA